MEIKLRVKKPQRKRVRKPKTKEQKLREQMNWIVRKYETGDLNLNKKSHRITAKIAIQKGLIPEEVLNDERYYQSDDES